MIFDAVVDPNIAQLPPHITFEQAHHLFSAMREGRSRRRRRDQRTDQEQCSLASCRTAKRSNTAGTLRARNARSTRSMCRHIAVPTRFARVRRNARMGRYDAGVRRSASRRTRPASATLMPTLRPRSSSRRCCGKRSLGQRRDANWRALERYGNAITRNLGRDGITSMAISAVDVALWDLKGKLLGVPARRRCSGAVRERVPVYGSGGFTAYSTRSFASNSPVGWAVAFRA